MKKKISTVDKEFATKPQKNFLDMIAPSVIKFFTDYFIVALAKINHRLKRWNKRL